MAASTAQGSPTICTQLQKPFPECYCMNITSATISKMLSLCIGDFTSCPVYRQRLPANEAPSALPLALCESI